jgi:hypothetical protein
LVLLLIQYILTYVGELALDLTPTSPFELDPESPKQNINFWMGQEGTLADTHYDAYENFNIQVYGKKKWTIFAPDQPLYLYPWLHPSNAQSQAVITKLDKRSFPSIFLTVISKKF